MKTTPLLALALAGLTLAGCADEEADVADPIQYDAEVVTEPTDDLAAEDSLLEAPAAVDTLALEEGVMTEQ